MGRHSSRSFQLEMWYLLKGLEKEVVELLLLVVK